MHTIYLLSILSLLVFTTVSEEKNSPKITKPEDATLLLPAEIRDEISRNSKRIGKIAIDVTMEQRASLSKLLGDADPLTEIDPKLLTPTEARIAIKVLEVRRSLKLKVAEILLISEQKQKNKFVESCYHLEDALIRSTDPNFKFSEISDRQRGNINYLLELLSDDLLFEGLPYEGAGRTIQKRLNKTNNN